LGLALRTALSLVGVAPVPADVTAGTPATSKSTPAAAATITYLDGACLGLLR